MKIKRYALEDSEGSRRAVYDLMVPDGEIDRGIMKDIILGDWLKSLVEQTGKHDPYDFHKLLHWGAVIPADQVDLMEEEVIVTIDEAFINHRDHQGIRFAIEILPPGVVGYSTQVLYVIGGKVYYDFVKAKEVAGSA